MKCLHFLMIIMDSFLGQHNPSNYFALTTEPMPLTLKMTLLISSHKFSKSSLPFFNTCCCSSNKYYLENSFTLNLPKHVKNQLSAFTTGGMQVYTYSMTQWLAFFFIYCFFGWCFESVYVSVHEHRWVNRGFMN